MLGNLDALLVRVFFPFLLSDILCSFIQGARPSKRKTGEDSTNNLKIDRKRKRARNQAGPPPGTQIVNLDPDLPAGPTSTHIRKVEKFLERLDVSQITFKASKATKTTILS